MLNSNLCNFITVPLPINTIVTIFLFIYFQSVAILIGANDIPKKDIEGVLTDMQVLVERIHSANER